MENISSALLDWFYKNHRILPFRTDPSPYHVWLSEIMLQQTRVSAALPYYERFLAALPDIPALAACEEEKLHKLWEGLGYYSRVRNLQKAARIVCEQYGGQLPADYDACGPARHRGLHGGGHCLHQLRHPGACGGRKCVAGVLPLVQRPRCRHGTGSEKSVHRPRDGAPAAGCARRLQSGLMELGALVCVPNGAPLCEKCPLAHLCAARAAGTALELPRKAAPKPRRLQPVTLALLESPAGFLLQQRPQKGLLAGLWQPVLWEGEALAAGEVLARLQAMGVDTGTAAPEALPAAKHIFSHIEWHMNGILLHVPAQDAPAGCVWASREALQAEYTLPGAFKAYRKLIV